MIATRSKAGAFTLLELLTVVAIIGILVGLLLVGLSAAKAQGRETACKNRLRQMGIALQMYVQDNHNRYAHYVGPPGPAYGDAFVVSGRGAGDVYWSTKLIPYGSFNWTNPLSQCPGYRGVVTGPYDAPNILNRHGSYGYNIWGSHLNGSPRESYGIGPIVFWPDPLGVAITESQVIAPSQMLTIGDSAWPAGTIRGTGIRIEPEPGGDDVLHCQINTWATIYDSRHGKKYNQLYCDTHVGSMRPQLLFTPSNSAALWNYDHQPHPEGW